MSVSRSIKIRVLTNHSGQSKFIEDLTENFWNFKNQEGTFSSIAEDDKDEFEFIDFKDVKTVYEILDKREKNRKVNTLTLWDDQYTESILLIINTLDNNYRGYNKHYEVSLCPGVGKRISQADRYTDYGHYLTQLIPKFKAMGCYVCEIECHDYDC